VCDACASKYLLSLREKTIASSQVRVVHQLGAIQICRGIAADANQNGPELGSGACAWSQPAHRAAGAGSMGWRATNSI
jgi:hypothetical protein